MVIVDDYSRKTWVYLLKEKSDALATFKQFVVMAERESDRKVKAVRSDRGGEFTSGAFKEYCKGLGIRQQLTAAYSPESNGIAERKNRTLQEMVRAMLHTTKLTHRLWGDAIMAANHVTNRRINSVLGHKTPEELWSGNVPTVRHLRIWGCKAMGYVEEVNRDGKLAPRSWKGFFVGYSENSMQYRVYNPETRTVRESRNVEFHEDLDGMIRGANESHRARDYEEESQHEEFTTEEMEEDTASVEEEEETGGTVPKGDSGAKVVEIGRSWGKGTVRRNHAIEVPSVPSAPTTKTATVEQQRVVEEEENDTIEKSDSDKEFEGAVRRSKRMTKGKPPLRFGFTGSTSYQRAVAEIREKHAEDFLL
jgi:hypothetical protein